MLVVGAFGILSLVFNSTNVFLLLVIMFCLSFAYTGFFIYRRVSKGDHVEETIFAVSFLVYEKSSLKEVPVKNASIKMMLDPHPVELDRTNDNGICNYSLEQRHYRRKI